MANRFWVGGTDTWNSTAGSKWSTTSGGAGGSSVPGTGDVALFDANSGASTVTVDSPNGAGVVTVQTITLTGFTGTLDFATNDNNVTCSVGGVGGTSGAFTLNMGDGTWNMTGTGASVWTLHNGMTLNAGASTLNILSTSTGANVNFANKTYNIVTVSVTNASGGQVNSQGSGTTFASLTLGSTEGKFNFIPVAMTVTSTFTVSGTASNQIGVVPASGVTVTLTGATATATWAAFHRITASGAAITATNSFDLGGNSNVTISAPSVGGGTVGVIGG